ncbi:MAG TPA: POTRA domain-containing protein [Vicinamibacterales bacterium]
MSARRRTGRLTVLILLLAGVLGVGIVQSAEGAVTDYLGRSIAQVRVEQEAAQVDDRAILDLIETRVGQPLEMTQVRETIGHLFSLGRYEDVQVRASPSGDGVVLVYDLVPLHHVRAIEFRGPIELDQARLRSAIIDRLGPTPPVGRSADAARILEDLYRDEGYRRPTITSSTRVEHNPDRTTLIFDIMPGARTLVGRIAVEGGQAAPAVVLDRIDLRMGDPFRPAALIAALDRYRTELQSQGYYQARATYLPRPSGGESTMDLTVIVETGPMVRLRFEGDQIPERERADLVPIARQRSVDEDLLEDSKRRIEDWLKGQGYRDARADYRREQTGDTLEIIFSVTRGPVHRLNSVEIVGSSMTAELRPLLRLKEGAPFVDAIFSADMAGMVEFYRRAGFANVKINTSVSPAEGSGSDRQVTAQLTVVEGARSSIGNVTFEGNQSIENTRLMTVAGLAPGQPFYAPQTEMAADAIVVEYLNRGYANARVERTLTVNEERDTVDVAFRVQEGVQVIIDHVLIIGNDRTKAEIIERELVLKPGQPLADSDMIESRRRLNALGLFRRVQIADVRHPGQEGRRDVLVTVEEALATTIGGGGGAEVGLRLERSAVDGLAEERIEFAPRGFFEIGRRNLWGKNRSINFFSRVSFRPNGGTSSTPDPDAPTDSGYGFNEYRVLLTYREPRVFGSTADGLLYGFLEQGVRSSFNFNRRGTRLEIVRRVTPETTVSGRYTLEQTRRFDERYNQSEEQNIDRLFPEFRLSALSSSLIRSTRDDAIDPSRGTLMTIDASIAARGIGSEVGFVEVLLKEFFYRQLPGAGRVILAGGATLGLARGSSSNLSEGADGETDSEQLTVPASERFYAGGDTTVRGFALDRLGTRDTIDQDGFPTGGQGLIIFNAELRFPVWGDLGGVGFLDVGNVYQKVSAIDFGELRGSVGVGIRYRSPIGPVRFDVGFKLSRFDFRTGAFNPDGTPETKLEPLTGFHISLGQAF